MGEWEGAYSLNLFIYLVRHVLRGIASRSWLGLRRPPLGRWMWWRCGEIGILEKGRWGIVGRMRKAVTTQQISG